jgi:NSS family neurotransmitter:Na+ symporter
MSKEAWGTRIGLVFAMAGNAVGLGNFLRFPVQAIQNGGGAFIIPYLVCFLFMGIPLLFIEWGLGRYGGQFGNHSTPFIFNSVSKKFVWKYVGIFGIFCNLTIAAYYCYIESWTLAYIFKSVTGVFTGKSAEEVAAHFGNYVTLSDSYTAVIFWLICLALNTYILSKGLSGGIEKVAKIGVPLLIIFGLLLAFQGVSLKAGKLNAIYDGTVGLNFLWTPKFDTIWTPKVWLAAAGQVFFTLSVGMGSIQCYASFIKKNDDIVLNSLSAGWMNEFVEVVIGASILIPISVGYLGIDKVIELTKSGGLGLGFKTLPFLFQNWGSFLAPVAGMLWFGLLFFAGITSSLAMGFPCMSFLQDEFNFTRKKAAFTFGIAALLLGLPVVFLGKYDILDEYDYWAGTVSLFVFSLLETILFVWVFGINNAWSSINQGADFKLPKFVKYIMLYITPTLLIFVFAKNIPEIINKISNVEIHHLISETTDAVKLNELSNKLMYTNLSRLLLISVFIGIGVLVFFANKKREKNKAI